MKSGRAAFVAVFAFTASVAVVSGFGPANCVSVSRSSAGTCVVQTKCTGQDLSKFDISFDCQLKSGSQTHSMGAGSFDLEEEYDTDLKCDECLPPQGVTGRPLAKRSKSASGVSLAVVSASHEVAKLRGSGPLGDFPEAKEEKPEVEWYGPDQCVGVWKDAKSGTCVMQTDCDEDTQLGVYEFGLLCADESDEMTRHVFGMGSFGHKETFNTLIKCDECLALDEYQDGNKGVDKLTNMVKDMRKDLQGVSEEVNKLNVQVFGAVINSPAPAPAAAAPAEAPKKEKKKALLAKPAVVEQAPAQQEQGPAQPATAPQEAVEQQPAVAVEHVKLRASQKAAAPTQNESMQDILAAAVKNAQANGVVLPATDTQALSQVTGQKIPQVVQQAVQTVVVEHKQRPAQKQANQDVEIVEEDDEDEGQDED